MSKNKIVQPVVTQFIHPSPESTQVEKLFFGRPI